MRFRHLIAICLLCLLSACSSKLAYNNLDWLSYWYVSDYIDLTGKQSSAVKDKLRSILKWHRTTHVPQYKDQLKTLKQDIESDRVTRESATMVMKFIRNSWTELRAKFVSGAIDLIPTLTLVQAEELFDNLAAKHEDDLEEIPDSPEKRFERRFEKLEELTEDYLGSITDQQKLILELYLGSSFDTRKAFLEGNGRMQQDLKADVVSFVKQPSQELLEIISSKLNNPEQYRSDEFKFNVAENRKLLSVMLADLAATLTPDQKVFLVNKIQNWIQLTDGLTHDEKEPAS